MKEENNTIVGRINRCEKPLVRRIARNTELLQSEGKHVQQAGTSLSGVHVESLFPEIGNVSIVLKFSQCGKTNMSSTSRADGDVRLGNADCPVVHTKPWN